MHGGEHPLQVSFGDTGEDRRLQPAEGAIAIVQPDTPMLRAHTAVIVVVVIDKQVFMTITINI